MTYSQLFMCIRTFIFIWCAFEFFNLAQLYWDGYEKIRPTPIIKALVYVLIAMGMILVIYAFVPMFRMKSCLDYMIMADWSSLFFIPMIIALRNFRKQSLTKQKKDLH